MNDEDDVKWPVAGGPPVPEVGKADFNHHWALNKKKGDEQITLKFKFTFTENNFGVC